MRLPAALFLLAALVAPAEAKELSLECQKFLNDVERPRRVQSCEYLAAYDAWCPPSNPSKGLKNKRCVETGQHYEMPPEVPIPIPGPTDSPAMKADKEKMQKEKDKDKGGPRGEKESSQGQKESEMIRGEVISL